MKKKYLIIIVIIFIILGISTYKHKTFYDVYAKVDITITEYNFGKITYLDTINYTFKIKNVSENPLIITQILSNCTCIITDSTQGVILSNNEAEIKTQFIPNKTRLGEKNFSILVEGNFNGGVTYLKLKGIVTDID